MHTPANVNVVPCMPIASIINGKYFKIIRQNIHSTVINKVIPKVFSFSGNTSAITPNGIDIAPTAPIKMTDARLNKGIYESHGTTFGSVGFSNEYKPSTHIETAIPSAESSIQN